MEQKRIDQQSLMFPINSKEIKEAAQFLSDLIKINTTNPPGNETEAAEFCARVLKEEGFEDVELIESAPGRGNLIVIWHGTDPTAKSLLLLAHLDVVPADPSNWEKDPFGGEIEGEYIWGRGSMDIKNMVVAEAMACILLKRQGFQPKGTIKLAFTADEERGGVMGVGYLTEHYWEKINADYIINEGGGFLIPLGKNPKDYVVQTGEKGVFRTTLRVRGVGGHGSFPIKKSESAMYKMAKICQKIIEYKYPIEITPAIKELADKISLPGFFKKILTSKRFLRIGLKIADKKMPVMSKVVLPFVMDVLNPTVFKASEKVNVIPQQVELSFDARLLPGHDRGTIEKYLRKALGKKLFNELEIIPIEPSQPATMNSTENPFWNTVEEVLNEMHEGAKMVPMLSSGSTDSKYFRSKGGYALGICPMKIDPNISFGEMLEMAHGKNERIWIPNLSYGLEFFYRLIKKMNTL
ncbi:MAG: M20/M25/M40 family metallo-hydrolase [Promethearchaeota archaeon]